MSIIDNVIHLFAPLAANCRDFSGKWEAAAVLGQEGVTGCWDGEWVSEASGHRGRLRCVLTPVAPSLWRMYFRAEYAKVFRACYSTDFSVAEPEPGRWTFKGGSDLGALAGGSYEYAGYATLTELICSYRSAKDHGEFRLRRATTT